MLLYLRAVLFMWNGLAWHQVVLATKLILNFTIPTINLIYLIARYVSSCTRLMCVFQSFIRFGGTLRCSQLTNKTVKILELVYITRWYVRITMFQLKMIKWCVTGVYHLVMCAREKRKILLLLQRKCCQLKYSLWCSFGLWPCNQQFSGVCVWLVGLRGNFLPSSCRAICSGRGSCALQWFPLNVRVPVSVGGQWLHTLICMHGS